MIKHKKLITYLMTIVMLCMMAVPALAYGDGTGGGSGPSDLVLNNAYVCTINGSTVTDGASVENSTVAAGNQEIDLYFNHNVSADYTIPTYTPQTAVFNTNANSIHLFDGSTGESITITRVGTGQTSDTYKQHLYFDYNFVSGHTYTVTLDTGTQGIICYNGGNLSTSSTTSFTITAQ